MALSHRKPAGSSSEQQHSQEAAAPSFPGKGFRLGEYEILSTLGQGAMATVYQAIDTSGNEVALKVFVEGSGVSRTMIERFRREAEATKKLRRHPHILTVYATGQQGPFHYIVMESIRQSKTLEDALEGSAMSIADIVIIHIKIARALHYAHSRRVIHRDVKPRNILIDEFGEPRLSDFGVAALSDWPSCTVTGALTGTPLYMSPEQAKGERTTATSDTFSLGVVLYESLTGVLPYLTQHGAAVRDVLTAVISEEPRRPRLYRKEISPDLEAIVLKAMEKTPSRRYTDAEDLATDLERALMGRPVTARHFSFWDHIRHRLRKHRQLVVIFFLILGAAMGTRAYFETRLAEVRHDSLLHYAQLQNALLRDQARRNIEWPETMPGAQRSWQEIRMARNAMRSGDWYRAHHLFTSAFSLATEAGDMFTAAIAQLDEARCLIMLHDPVRALELYRDVALHDAASPATRATALYEFLLQSLLRGEEDEARSLLTLANLPPDGPMRSAMECLSGDLSPDFLTELIPMMPPRFKNDAWLAVAVHYSLQGDEIATHASLEACLRASSPATEWPAPFARLMLSDMVR